MAKPVDTPDLREVFQFAITLPSLLDAIVKRGTCQTSIAIWIRALTIWNDAMTEYKEKLCTTRRSRKAEMTYM